MKRLGVLFRFLICACVLTPIIARTSSAQPNQPQLREKYRLLFSGRAVPEGLRIRAIQPASPVLNMQSTEDESARGSAEVGDIITAVDGKPVTSLRNYFQSLDDSQPAGGLVTLSIQDRRTGVISQWKVQGVRVLVHDAPEPTPRRAHFVLIGLTSDNPNDGLSNGIKISLQAWEQTIGSLHDERVGSTVSLTGEQCNAQNIRNRIRQMQLPSQDVLFCYYAGHGAHQRALANTDEWEGRYFDIPSGDLWRRDLWSDLDSRNTRLTILISDTCSTEGSYFSTGPQAYGEQQFSSADLSPFENLLFSYQGDVDISASSINQYSFFDNEIGGWFTSTAIDAATEKPTWGDAFAQMKERTDILYADRRRRFLPNNPAADSTPELRKLRAQNHLIPKDIRLQVAEYQGSLRTEYPTRTFTVPTPVDLPATTVDP